MNVVLGKKQIQTQRFLEDGERIPVTLVAAMDTMITATKTMDKHGYWAVQLGCSFQPINNIQGKESDAKGPKTTSRPRFLREVRVESEKELESFPAVGEKLVVTEVLKPGDVVDVTGVSKGKGFAGGVKRHHFKGGPRTHGQSDRERAPGSIGQTTTPGRVYKGKRMAGKMGNERVTVKNLLVVGVEDDTLLIKGLVPGIPGGLLYIKKTGEMKKFVPLLEEKKEGSKEVQVEVAEAPAEAVASV